MSFWFVCLAGFGGALGALARYGVGRWMVRMRRRAIWGTLAVNWIGSFAAGLFAAIHLGTRTPAVYVFAVPGILGGLTTYSTLNVQKAQLASEGNRALAAKYAAITYIGGLLCAAVGTIVGTLFFT